MLSVSIPVSVSVPSETSIDSSKAGCGASKSILLAVVVITPAAKHIDFQINGLFHRAHKIKSE